MTRYIFLIIFSALSLLSAPTEAGVNDRDQSLAVACMEMVKISGVEASEEWCKCQNAYYADLLNDADWKKYTEDYYALVREQNSNRSTPANSYERYVQLGGSTCGGCVRSDYKDRGCSKLAGRDISRESHEKLVEHIRMGQFNQVKRDDHYNAFFVNFISGYSAFCGDRLRSYVERTTTSTTWESVNHVWYEKDTSVGTIRVEDILWPSYESRESAMQGRLVTDMFGSIMQDLNEGRLPTTMLTQAMTSVVDPVVYMRGLIADKCDAPDVQLLYNNVKRFELGQEPIRPANADQLEKNQNTAQEQRYEEIRKLTRISRDKSTQIYAQEKARQAALPKGEMGPACEGLEEKTRNAAIRVPRGSGGLTGLEGSWRGQAAGQTMEMVTWNVGHNKDYVNALGYFPDNDCFVNVRIGDGMSLKTREFAHMSITPKPQDSKPGNCVGWVIDDKDREVHFFKAQGYFNWKQGNRYFDWHLNHVKLGSATPQSCEAIRPARFEQAPISAAFSNELFKHSRQYPKMKIPLERFSR